MLSLLRFQLARGRHLRAVVGNGNGDTVGNLRVGVAVRAFDKGKARALCHREFGRQKVFASARTAAAATATTTATAAAANYTTTATVAAAVAAAVADAAAAAAAFCRR